MRCWGVQEMWPVHEHQNINKRPEWRINAIYRSAKKNLASRNTSHWSNYNWDNNIANFRFIIMIWSLINWSKLRPYFAKTLWYEAFGWLIYLDAFINSAWDKNKATYITFNSICNTIHNHFEGLEYKYKVLTKWNAIILKTIMIKNKGKSTEDCL